MDIMVIIHKKGISGLKELTKNIIDNLNFRPWSIKDYTSHGMFGYSGSREIEISSAVADTEVIKYLTIFFSLDDKEAKEIVETLIGTGFLEIVYKKTNFCPGWVDREPWNKLLKGREVN
jgi:hypothetical protein